MSDHQSIGAEKYSSRLEALNWVLLEVKKSSTIVTNSLQSILGDRLLATSSGSLSKSPAALSNIKLALAEMKRASGALQMAGQEVCGQIYQDIATLLDHCMLASVVVEDGALKTVRMCCNTVNAYLTGVSAGRNFSSLTLLPAAHSAAVLAKRLGFHPAQLANDPPGYTKGPLNWSLLIDLKAPEPASSFDKLLLRLFRGDTRATQELAGRLKAKGELERDLKAAFLSYLGAAFLYAYSVELIESDIYAKRTASSLVRWLQGQALGDASRISLLRETQYFLNRSKPDQIEQKFPAIVSLTNAGYLNLVDSSLKEGGTDFLVFDPDIVTEVLDCLAAAKIEWTQVTAGDLTVVQQVMSRFSSLHRKIEKLGAHLPLVTGALERCVTDALAANRTPSEEVALEVATAMLFLEATLDDQFGFDSEIQNKTQTICARLERARKGEPLEKLQVWMETLFHRSGSRQSLGNVAGELRHISGEIERNFEALFANVSAQESDVALQRLKVLLLQIKGVLGVIGLEQGVLAVTHLHSKVGEWNHLLQSQAQWQEIVDNVGANMATLGLMVDMLGYQPVLANRLFRFDPSTQTLNLGVTKAETPTQTIAGFVTKSETVTTVSRVQSQDNVVDAELQDVFFQEAKEVVQDGLDFVSTLALDSKDIATLVALRRGFHTLKGSARMVGLSELGEAAWVMEQLLNEQLTDELKPVSEHLCALSKDALGLIRKWADRLSQGQNVEWTAEPFRDAAQLLRSESIYRPINVALVQSDASSEFEAAQFNDLVPNSSEHMTISIDDDDFVLDETVSAIESDTTQVQSDLSNLEVDAKQPLIEVGEDPPEDVQINQLDVVSQGVQVQSIELPTPILSLHEASDDAEQFKMIGPLKIRFNLYNVYLQEADEVSRALETSVTEWVLDQSQPLSENVANLAHTLAGSSATVGFFALAELCKDIEAGVFYVITKTAVDVEYAHSLKAGVDAVRYLLHQFAAGFLKEPDAALLKNLKEFPATKQEDNSDLQREIEAEAGTPSTMAASVELTRVDLDVVTTSQTSAESDADFSMVALFAEEASELVPHISHWLDVWMSPSGTEEGRQEVLRGLHTLKGSARLVGAMTIGDRVHQLEAQVEQADPNSREIARVLFDQLDLIEKEIRQSIAGLNESAVTAGDLSSVEVVADVQVTESPAPVPTLQPVTDVPQLVTPVNMLESSFAQRVVPIRVNTRLLDTVVNRVGEVISTRARIKSELDLLRGTLVDLDTNIGRLRHQLRELEIQAESQMQSRMVFHKDADSPFDPLELDRYTRVQELTRMMAESVSDVATVQLNLARHLDLADDSLIEQGRQSKELQHELLRTRIVPFDTVSQRLVRTVRQAANDTDKLVQFELVGGMLEIDRQQLEKIGPSLEHVIRNAIAHGIESPQERVAIGKSETGRIDVSVHQDRNDIVIEIRDDGRGLDLEKIKQKAVALSLLSEGAVIDHHQAFELICLPGFTTAMQVDELAGRGIGMDIVKSSVNAAGGRLEGVNTPNYGLTVRMILPLTTATTQVLLVRHGEKVTAFPVNMVEQVLRFRQDELEKAYSEQQIIFAEEFVPFYWAGALLSTSHRSALRDVRSQPVVVVRSAGRRVAVHVDDIVGQREVLVRGVGEQLSNLPGLTGISILHSGDVVFIYNPVALVLVYRDEIAAFSAATPANRFSGGLGASAVMHKSESSVRPRREVLEPCVLVVDDSITVRKVSQRLLERAGYRVALAADGLAALGLLRKELADQPPFLIIADIEMPRMDGFEMIKTLKVDDQLSGIPVIVVTSRLAEKHREVARSLGIEHYLGKPFVEDQLLDLVAHYRALVIV